ncbi:hypothetical protein ACEE21_15025 [Clostridium baratii]
MALSFLIMLLVLFLVFMFTAEGVSDSAKTISIGLSVIAIIWIIFKIL